MHTSDQGLIGRIWDWQSTIWEDLNDSQDPKHTLFRRENAFVAILPFLDILWSGTEVVTWDIPEKNYQNVFTLDVHSRSSKIFTTEYFSCIWFDRNCKRGGGGSNVPKQFCKLFLEAK